MTMGENSCKLTELSFKGNNWIESVKEKKMQGEFADTDPQQSDFQ